MRIRKNNLLLGAPIAQTKYGSVRGRSLVLADEKKINAFLGIPYAKPPIGELRFKKPEPPESWTLLDARRYKDRPIQKNYIWDYLETGVSISEDCLYLNIIAPADKNDQFPDGYPVIFYIHGGGYVIDAAAKYNYKKVAKTLVAKNTIVITVEYRLGFLGFLCLDDKQAKGNYGVWDVIEALKFTKENIESFGGDPNKITVMGQSAGSCMADLLSISPVCRDLFQQKILMAGFSENSWALANKHLVVNFCREKALQLGFQRTSELNEWSEEENVKCMEFLRQVPSHKFGMTMIGDKSIISELRLALTPVLDDEIFPRPIQKLREESAPKNSLVGVTKYEGLLFLALGRRMANHSFLEFCERKVEEILTTHVSSGASELITILAYKELYGINEMMRKNKKTVKRVCVDIMSDLINGIGLHSHCIQSANSGGTCYRYIFEQYNSSLTSAFNLFLPFTGSTHGCELPYIFGVNIFITPFLKTKADRRVTDITTKMWTNFARYGNPNGDPKSKFKEFEFDWKPVTSENAEQHLVIKDGPKFEEKLEATYFDKLLPVLEALYATLSASALQ